jgi:hypothetical protein
MKSTLCLFCNFLILISLWLLNMTWCWDLFHFYPLRFYNNLMIHKQMLSLWHTYYAMALRWTLATCILLAESKKCFLFSCKSRKQLNTLFLLIFSPWWIPIQWSGLLRRRSWDTISLRSFTRPQQRNRMPRPAGPSSKKAGYSCACATPTAAANFVY